MQATRLLQLNNSPQQNYQHLSTKFLAKITYYAQAKQTPFQKKSKLITINEYLTCKIKEDN